MTDKLSKIGRWVLVVLAAITIGFTAWFYMTGAENIGGFLDWGYIVIILGIVLALVSVIVQAIVKKPNPKKVIISILSILVVAVIAYFMSTDAFTEVTVDGQVYSASTMGWLEIGLNFFYVAFGVSLATILFSIIYKAVK